jgi:hypothetical protein
MAASQVSQEFLPHRPKVNTPAIDACVNRRSHRIPERARSRSFFMVEMSTVPRLLEDHEGPFP